MLPTQAKSWELVCNDSDTEVSCSLMDRTSEFSAYVNFEKRDATLNFEKRKKGTLPFKTKKRHNQAWWFFVVVRFVFSGGFVGFIRLKKSA